MLKEEVKEQKFPNTLEINTIPSTHPTPSL